ncbi:FABP family protein [Microbacterium sp. C7(2022)]|uniref:FABP family protein n=1 Tax=Microbacterium sp. C7(2022) TaxID=2992759 RepID=UPI00237B6F00|nr:FABP family protein [Microbacterium sp. C7(2022)]MDE0547141.1 FABP family protein [Microbacterium sp. C7(2022)]
MLEIPTDLPAELAPLSWLIGVWEGTGVIDYDTEGHHFAGEFTHRVSFSHDGGTFLNYSATAWLHGDGDQRTPLVSESGFWRVAIPAASTEPGPALLPPSEPPAARTVDDIEAMRNTGGGFDIEVALVHSNGVSELYLGQINGPRIDIATDAIVSPAGGKNYGAATRMYGLVDGHLLWAWDIAALGHELASHASARLARAL